MVRPLTTLGFFVLDRCLGRLRRRRRATLRRETSLSHDARLPSPFSSLSATSCSISHLIISPLRVSRFLASSSSQDEYHQLDSSNDRFFMKWSVMTRHVSQKRKHWKSGNCNATYSKTMFSCKLLGSRANRSTIGHCKRGQDRLHKWREWWFWGE